MKEEDILQKLEEYKVVVHQLKNNLEGLEKDIEKLSILKRELLSNASIIKGLQSKIEEYSAKQEKLYGRIEKLKNKANELYNISRKYSGSSLGEEALKEAKKYENKIKVLEDSLDLYESKIDSLRKVSSNEKIKGKKKLEQFKKWYNVFEKEIKPWYQFYQNNIFRK